jgi:hypothetical protein
MKRALSVAAVLTLLTAGGFSIWAVAGGKNAACSNDASVSDPASCESGSKSATVARASGKVLGNFDLAMAGCRFSCATKAKYNTSAIVAQPGAKTGKLTQCPVSGVVFTIDSQRPLVQVGADGYVTCCGTCADKLRKNPRRFVKV